MKLMQPIVTVYVALLTLSVMVMPVIGQSASPAGAASSSTPAAGMSDQATAVEDLDGFENKTDRYSYFIGMDLASSFKQVDMTLNMEMLSQGYRDMASGEPTRLDKDQMTPIGRSLRQEMQQRHQELREKQATENAAEAESFLAENRTKEGVMETESGLQYQVLEEGDSSGRLATQEDRVLVHYKGELLDGTQFDSSYDRGEEPMTFNVRGGIIRGWQEALQLMKPGDKFKLFIPPDLGYGQYGRPNQIPPNALLIFEIELIDFAEMPTPPSPAPQPQEQTESESESSEGGE